MTSDRSSVAFDMAYTIVTHYSRISILAAVSYTMAKNPAVATAKLIINDYKRRAVLIVQKADVVPTTVGVTHLRFMKM